MIIPNWMIKYGAPVVAFMVAYWAILANNWNQRRKGANEKEAEIEAATNKLIIKNTKRKKEIKKSVKKMSEAELDANARDNGWM